MTVGIIGGGFAGIAVAAYLIEMAKVPLRLYLCDGSQNFPCGTAYATTEISHTLNVRAKQMGIWNEGHASFVAWLKKHGVENDNANQNEDIEGSFASRNLFGKYLQTEYGRIVRFADAKGCCVDYVNGEVENVTKNETHLTLIFKEGKQVDVDKCVLATGVPVSCKGGFLKEGPAFSRYVSNFWGMYICEEHFRSYIQEHKLCGEQSANAVAVIIGSGLTAVDVILSLVNKGYQGKIMVISTAGKFPQAHPQQPANMLVIDRSNFPSKLLPLMRKIRRDFANQEAAIVVEALREHAQTFWQGFSPTERRQFLRHLFGFWNRLRHRIAPVPAAMMAELIAQGTLKMHAGKVVAITPVDQDENHVNLEWISAINDKHQMKVDLVVNCTGPNYRLNAQQGLLQKLLENRMIEADPLDLGIAVDADLSAIGAANNQLYGIGGVLFGSLFETTAVPEIRQQAQIIAKSILAHIEQV